MNKIMLSGRLTEYPRITYSSGGAPSAHAVFNFAVPDMSGKGMHREITPPISSDAPHGEILHPQLNATAAKALSSSLQES